MKGVRRLVGNLLWEILADAGIASVVATTVAGTVAGAALARRERLGAFGSFG